MSMTLRPIDFSDLSKHRSQLMGVAMIIVVLFHIGGGRHDTLWYCLARCGNVGVDMFLFLSGIGLWYSWSKLTDGQKRPDRRAIISFYWRRYRRIYPAWLIVACLYYIPLAVDGRLDVADTVLSIAVNWGFWEHDELTFWFIPAIMMLYTFAPAYLHLVQRHPVWQWLAVAAMVLCVLIQYWPPLHRSVGHIEIFFSRIPIFLLGINAGRWVKERHTLEPSALWLLLLVFAMSAVACVNFEDGLRGRFPLFLERMVYIPLTVSMLLLLCRLLDHSPQWACRTMAFVGGISLEIYLLHAHFVLRYVRTFGLGYWLTSVATIALSALLAWLLHKLTAERRPKNTITNTDKR